MYGLTDSRIPSYDSFYSAMFMYTLECQLSGLTSSGLEMCCGLVKQLMVVGPSTLKSRFMMNF